MSARNEPEETDTPLPPSESLALIQRQRAAVHSQLRFNWRMIYGAWGIAYLIGFGGLYLQRTVAESVPVVAAGVLLFFLLLTAMIGTGAHMMHVTRGVYGASTTTHILVSWTYLVGFLTSAAITVGLLRIGVPEPVVTLVLPGLSLMVMGLIYMVSGAYGRERLQFLLGTWILVTNAAAILSGLPWAFLILAVAGGGVFLLGAVFHPWLDARLSGTERTHENRRCDELPT